MTRERLSILYVSPTPTSLPRFGAQARMHGLTQLAQRHELTAVMLIDEVLVNAHEGRRTMKAYCHEVVLVSVPAWEILANGWCSSAPWPRSFEQLPFISAAAGLTHVACISGASHVQGRRSLAKR
jgi:hypothetical protein